VAQYGRPRLGNKRNPFSELLYILLSSKTPPERYQEVYQSLRRAYPRAGQLADARSDEVATLLRRAGLQNRKARAIVAIAQRLRTDFGRVTLAPLARMTDEEAEAFLTSLPEVNKKTARCVLMYALDRCVLPVDSHALRIARRLGWVTPGACLTDACADELQERVPKPFRHDLHVGMIILGRRCCLPAAPRCSECPILRVCTTGKDGLCLEV